jgi:hypothetical protein
MQDDNTIETMTPTDGPCEDCGKPGHFGTCPYAEEIHGKKVEVILCNRCAWARTKDI